MSRVGPLKSVEASVGAGGYLGPRFLGRIRVQYTATVWLACGGPGLAILRTAPCCNREGEITARAVGRGTFRRRVLFVHGGARGLPATSPFILCMMFCLGFCLGKGNECPLQARGDVFAFQDVNPSLSPPYAVLHCQSPWGQGVSDREQQRSQFETNCTWTSPCV